MEIRHEVREVWCRCKKIEDKLSQNVIHCETSSPPKNWLMKTDESRWKLIVGHMSWSFCHQGRLHSRLNRPRGFHRLRRERFWIKPSLFSVYSSSECWAHKSKINQTLLIIQNKWHEHKDTKSTFAAFPRLWSTCLWPPACFYKEPHFPRIPS